jgi:hypothetical protein
LLATIAFFVDFIGEICKDCLETIIVDSAVVVVECKDCSETIIVDSAVVVVDTKEIQTIRKSHWDRIDYFEINHCNSTRLVIVVNSVKIAKNEDYSLFISVTSVPLNAAIVYKVNAYPTKVMIIKVIVRARAVSYFGSATAGIIAIAILLPFPVLV